MQQIIDFIEFFLVCVWALIPSHLDLSFGLIIMKLQRKHTSGLFDSETC